MATSANFTTTNGYIVYYITITQNSQSVLNNTSSVTVNVYVKRTNTGYTTYGTGTTYATINGVAYSASITTDMSVTSTPRLLLSKVLTIPHNADGTKTLAVTNCYISHSQFSSSANSFSAALTTIARASSLSVFNNFTIGATVPATISTASASFTHNISLYINGTKICERAGLTTTSATITLTVAEQNACYTAMGTSYTGTAVMYCATLSGGTQIGDTTNKSATVTATPSAITSFTSFEIGNTAPITITRATNSLYTHNLVLKIGATTIASRTGLTTTGTFTLTAAENNIMYSALKNSTSGSVTVYCTTKNGSLTIGSVISRSATASVKSTVVPTFTSITASGVNAITGTYIKNITPITFTINGAAGASYSTITGYKINFNGINYAVASVTTGVINASGSLTAIATITDSRGRTAVKTVAVTLLDYVTPTISFFNVERASNTTGTVDIMGTYAKVSATATVKSLMNGTEKNLLTYKLYSKHRTTATWTLLKTATSSLSLTGYNSFSTYAVTSSYDFKIEVTDKITATVTAVDVMSTGQVTMSLGKTGIGIGKIWESGALDVEGAMHINGDILGSTIQVSKVANAIVRRDSAGDIFTRLVRSDYTNQTTISGALAFRVNNTTDTYIRFCSDAAAIRAFIGAPATSHTHTFASITSKPTTKAGYGITDAVPNNASSSISGKLTTTAGFGGVGRVAAFTWTGAIAGNGYVTITHSLGYNPIMIVTCAGSGISGNLVITTKHISTTQAQIGSYSNAANMTVNFY